MGDSSSVWGAVISGLVSAYSNKKSKDKANDQYKYQQQELDRQRQYAEEAYQRRQNAPSAKMARYLTEYYLPQYVNKLKTHSKGGDTSVLDRMLADIMGGITHNSSGASGNGQGGSDPFLVRAGMYRV